MGDSDAWIPYTGRDRGETKRLEEQEIETYLSSYFGRPVQVVGIQLLGGESSGRVALKDFGYGQPLCVD